MSFRKFPVLVLQTPGSKRSIPLMESLMMDDRLEVIPVQSKMLSDFPISGVVFNDDKFNFFEGRRMTPSEIGCAFSHNMAHKFLADTKSSGVILEDDGRIPDVNFFYDSVINFLDQNERRSAILSLTGFRYDDFQTIYRNIAVTTQYLGIQGKSDLAVGYVLTHLAANELHKSNAVIRSVSDWPENKCKYFISLNPSVIHGDLFSGSTIERFSPNAKSIFWHKLKLFTFFAFFFQNNLGIDFNEYFRRIFSTRIFWHFDSTVIRIKIRFWRGVI